MKTWSSCCCEVSADSTNPLGYFFGDFDFGESCFVDPPAFKARFAYLPVTAERLLSLTDLAADRASPIVILPFCTGFFTVLSRLATNFS
jgi:hypothetical protein